MVTLFVASVAIYGALFLAPGNPATLLAGGHATPAVLRAIERTEHLNEPFLIRYWDWLVGVVHGNLGESFVYREPVTTLARAAASSNTVFLVIYASILIILGGVALGLLGGLRRRAGVVVTVATSIGLGIPSFVAAIILITVFAVNLRWFPVFGAGTGFFDQVHHLTLPAVALAISWLAYVAQLTKAAVREELSREHVETARSRGIRNRHVVTRHVLRNAMIPITTVSGLTVAGLIAGDVVVEQAFGINGLGSFLVQSTLQKDFASVQAVSLILVAAFVIVNAHRRRLEPPARPAPARRGGPVTTATIEEVRPARRRSRSALWRDPVALGTGAFITLLVLVAVLAPLIAPYNPDNANILATNEGVSAAHWLGTDSFGRDLLSRLIYGARLSLLGPALIITVATILGTVLAIARRVVRGMARPGGLTGRRHPLRLPRPDLRDAGGRHVRTGPRGPGHRALDRLHALSHAGHPRRGPPPAQPPLRRRPATSMGLPARTICWRHLLPNVMPLLVVQATLSFGYALVDLAAVSYLGLGVQPPTAEWGLMVSTGQSSILAGHPQESLAAGLMIVATVVAFNLLGDRLATRHEATRR